MFHIVNLKLYALRYSFKWGHVEELLYGKFVDKLFKVCALGRSARVVSEAQRIVNCV